VEPGDRHVQPQQQQQPRGRLAPASGERASSAATPSSSSSSVHSASTPSSPSSSAALSMELGSPRPHAHNAPADAEGHAGRRSRFQPWDLVEVRGGSCGGEWCPAVLEAVEREGDFTVILDEDKTRQRCGHEDIRQRAKKMKLAELSVGQHFRGVVRKLTQLGAFVDIGADRHGLVRRARMAARYVEAAEELVQVGQRVDVWVYRLPKNGKLGLSMVKYGHSSLRDPVAVFAAALPTDTFDAVVRFSHESGVYVDVEAPGGGHVQGLLPRRLLGAHDRDPKPGHRLGVRMLRAHDGSGTLMLSASS